MSVHGGDGGDREAQLRKRRVDNLILSTFSSSSFKKLSNGKFVCLVCPKNPVLDSPLLISVHSKGYHHVSAASKLAENESSKQKVLSKRIALSVDSAACSSASRHFGSRSHQETQEKPLVEKTRMAILEAQSTRLHDARVRDGHCCTITATCNCNSSKPMVDFLPIAQAKSNSGEELTSVSSATLRSALTDWIVEHRIVMRKS